MELFLKAWACWLAAQLSVQALPAAQTRAEVVVVFSNDIRGRLDPCGCDFASSLGGIERRHTFTQQIVSTPKILVDAGNAFFEQTSNIENWAAINRKPAKRAINTEYVLFKKDSVTAEGLIEYFSQLEKLVVANVGYTDLAMGLNFIKNRGIPYVSCNLLDKKGQPAFPALKIIAGIAFIGLTRPQAFGYNNDYKFGDAKTSLKSALAETGEAQFRILLTDEEMDKLQDFKKQFDLIFLSRITDEKAHEMVEDNVLSCRIQGRQLGVLRLQNHKMVSHEIVNLISEIPTDREASQIVDDVKRKISQIDKALGTRYYDSFDFAGSLACQRCHLEVYDRWLDTKHAFARNALEKKREEEQKAAKISGFFPSVYSSSNIECLSCHTIGVYKPGGPQSVSDVNQVSLLHNVGCESCHGAGKAHVLAPSTSNIKIDKESASCNDKSCHVELHSANFHRDWLYEVTCNKTLYDQDIMFFYDDCITSGCHVMPHKWKDFIANSADAEKFYKDKGVPMRDMPFTSFIEVVGQGRKGREKEMPAFQIPETRLKIIYDYLRENIWAQNTH